MMINIFWFRRDLRLEDNRALAAALKEGLQVLTVFIFDKNITDELPANDPRLSFIYNTLASVNNELHKSESSLYILSGDPEMVWKQLISVYDVGAVYINKDYEPYSIQRDNKIEALLLKNNIELKRYKDQVIFEESEIVKDNDDPYTIFTPYKKKWLNKLAEMLPLKHKMPSHGAGNYFKCNIKFPSLKDLGFNHTSISVRKFDLSSIHEYDKFRDFPFADKTSYLSPHLRFGTVSIRNIAASALAINQTFLSELIWREFFMQILYFFPDVVTGNFRKKYDGINWNNKEDDFGRWCNGETGFPLVDAGMRQLNETGYMHNRVRMVAAGFLCKHLLIDWRWGEAYFAEKLLDYELSSNNGNWQWAAGTGCDAAPYFRIFNPYSQQKRFDPKMEYIRKWLPDIDNSSYPGPMIDNNFARKRALEAYKSALFK